MNGQLQYQQTACRACTKEHGFDCHCSCASKAASVRAALGPHYSSQIDYELGKEAYNEGGLAAVNLWCARLCGAWGFSGGAPHHPRDFTPKRLDYIGTCTNVFFIK